MLGTITRNSHFYQENIKANFLFSLFDVENMT